MLTITASAAGGILNVTPPRRENKHKMLEPPKEHRFNFNLSSSVIDIQVTRKVWNIVTNLSIRCYRIFLPIRAEYEFFLIYTTALTKIINHTKYVSLITK